MRSVPDWVESVRGLILVVVWAVLILRIPALRRPRQRPVWLVLFVLAMGSVAIQEWVGQWIDGVTGVPKASELAVVFVALTDFAAVWWFAITLQQAGGTAPAWLRRAPLVCAVTMAVLATALFTVTPPADRFGSQAHGWWVVYALVWISYGLITAVGAAAVFWRYGVTMRSPVLRLSVLALAVGTSAEVPYLVIRGIRWFTDAPPDLVLVGFWCSFARFMLVALGCSLAALEPLLTTILYWYRRQRLHSLWLLLRQATPELQMGARQSRMSELWTFKDIEELLHQRMIEIRDSITFLHDGWASPEMLQQAERHAAAAGKPRHLAVACWLEVTRRNALEGAPKLHHKLDRHLLPEVLAAKPTVRREVRQFLRLHRALRSSFTRGFADDFQRRATTGSAL
ncbi:DUF6545 domain-containing protein [Sinosporangium siamense]|uniref:DUF6545 domain-containing protein n=1 Tax=Sinosporangium siamense TaxID=1367973 RepID=A0A919RJJ9_9ACTN|nr:DUF6545 domain-containing protein [Sinosporangium siamense]GII95035.1 hypothetical protein Ssi02_52660 [Sinosporangium siamense]